jgi:hypothetical protein
MMVKEARYVDDVLNGPLHIYEPQPVALKATNSREELPSKVAQVEVAGLNEDEMALIIKRFKTTLKGRKEYPSRNKTMGKRSCFKCGKTGHFIAQCPDNDNDHGQEKYGKKEKKKNYKKAKGEAHLGKEWDSDCSSSDSDAEGLAASAFKKSSLFPNKRHTCLMAKEKKKNYKKVKGEAHLGQEWDSDCSSSDSDDEGLAASTFDKSSLFPNERHTCLMAKEKKVRIRDSPKYSSSSDEESSNGELIDALNEKDRLLE